VEIGDERDRRRYLSTRVHRAAAQELRYLLELSLLIPEAGNFSISRGNFIETKPQHIEK
jgi:hypothetical protein